MRIEFVVSGKLMSMKNKKIQTRRGITFKPKGVERYERDFCLQVPMQYRNLALGSLSEPLAASVTVFYPSMKSDVDVELVWDCLQTAGVIANDRYIREKHIFGEIDAVNPRVEIEIYPRVSLIVRRIEEL